MTVDLTDEERAAVRALERLAKRWPETLSLFSWAGSLHVIKPARDRTIGEAIIASISGIPNEGGDPNWNDPST